MKKESIIISLFFFSFSCVNITSEDDQCRDLFKAKHRSTPGSMCAELLTVVTRGGTRTDGIGRDLALYQCAAYYKSWTDCKKKSGILPTITGGVKP